MASEKNITMRQFNGTDYDTLYPKTDVKQIENLTPSSIGAVAKSGDTMTGELNIKANAAFMNLTSWFDAYFGNKNVAITSYQSEDVSNADASRITLNNGGAYYQRCENGVWVQTAPLLNSGNAQTLGFSKIATGSYVGTGTYGSANPNSLTFDFEPKIVFLSVDSSASAFSETGFMFFIRNQSGSPSWYYYNSAYVGRTITWSGNTLSWYTLAGNPNDAPDRQQFNVSGQRYCYVALG